MKRFLFVTVLAVSLVGVMLYFVPSASCCDVLDYVDCKASVNIYCRQTSLQCVSTGLGYQVTCNSDEFVKTVGFCSKVDGVSARFSGNANDVDALINRLQADVVSCQQLGELYVFCCESPLLKNGVAIDGKRVNVQIALSNNTVTVGSPLILGDY